MTTLERMTVEIARCRLILSVIAVGFVIVADRVGEPTAEVAMALAIIAAHVAYASFVLFATHHTPMRARVGAWAVWVDAAFAVATAIANSGVPTTFFAFSLFAVVATALGDRPRHAIGVTVACIAIYVQQALLVGGADAHALMMRAVGLGVLGYLVVHLAESRALLEAEVRVRDAAAERERLARHLHDGCVGLLAAIDVRLEADRQLVRAGRVDEALRDLAELRDRVQVEHGDLRAFSRRLAAVDGDVPTSAGGASAGTRFDLDVRCQGSADVVESVLAILRESIRNVERHAHAARATLRVHGDAAGITCEVDDDGVGFAADATAPWSITSRVRALGGFLRRNHGPGARLSISLPRF